MVRSLLVATLLGAGGTLLPAGDMRLEDGGTTEQAATTPSPAPVPIPPGARPEWRSWYEPAEPMRIVGPIHFVGTRGLLVYLITTPAGHILIDGAMPGTEPLIEASIRKLGFRPEEIRLLLNTHAHADHAGTTAHFKALSGARLAAMKHDDRLLASGGKADYLYATEPVFHFPPVRANEVLRDADTVTVGDVTLMARRTSGHTRGGTTWIVSVDDGGTTYRVVFPCSTWVNPGTRLVREPSYRGIADDYRRAFEVQAGLHPDIFLTAHPEAMDFDAKRELAATEGARAFVDPEGYRRMVARGKERFESLVAAETSPPDLGGTTWRMLRFEGGDDTTLTPDDPGKYTMAFGADGVVAVRFDCNRGRGSWKTSGPRLELGPLALTRAMCPPGSLHDRLVKDWGFIRSFVLRDGHLFLSLQADGGIYEFEPAD